MTWLDEHLETFVRPQLKETFVLDTGYRGSVPKAMGIQNFILIRSWAATPKEIAAQQIFPKAKGIFPGLSSTLEGCPKYWTRAIMANANPKKGGKIRQTLDSKNFKTAAMLTIHVARSVDMLRVVLTRLAS